MLRFVSRFIGFFAVTLLCSVSGALPHSVEARSVYKQDQAESSSAKPEANQAASSAGKTQPGKAPVKKKSSTDAKSAGARKTASSAAAHRTPVRQKRRPVSPRVRRMRQAFVESASLRPMAQQLLQDRTPPAYAGVQAYAYAHTREDAGALAWLVLGYAHVLDHDYAKAIDPLTRAKARAGDLEITSPIISGFLICKPATPRKPWRPSPTLPRYIPIRCW